MVHYCNHGDHTLKQQKADMSYVHNAILALREALMCNIWTHVLGPGVFQNKLTYQVGYEQLQGSHFLS